MQQGLSGWLAERQTHTYIRHGTTSLFAALDIATGAVDRQVLQTPPLEGVLGLSQTDRYPNAKGTGCASDNG